MTRLDRLELVVRSLADRVLGEEYTFDAIAEQEAAEQGVAFTPPATAVPAFDPAPILAELAALQDRVTSLGKLVMAHERDLQAILQTEVMVEDKRAVAV
jgi:hypothetical protein